MDKLPTSLETVDDYVNTCENFVLPLFYKQAKKIVTIIQELHDMIEQGNVEQERIRFCVNQIKELAAFANKESNMYPYFQAVADLEKKLEAEGIFDNDT